MTNTSTIPKDLPKTNPLLFSFLVILDALKENVVFSGKYERSQDKITPAFEYAVNSWSVVTDATTSVNGEKMIQMRVSCAIWNEKHDLGDCGVSWTTFPDGSEVKRIGVPAQEVYEFEKWRNSTFDTLEKIISTLVFKDDASGRKKFKTLADIFGWTIEGDRVDYLYAISHTSNQFYGVGATFLLNGYYYNCCPLIETEHISSKYLDELGFIFQE